MINYLLKLEEVAVTILHTNVLIGASKTFIGIYATPEEAFYAYKQAKEAYIKEVASKWKHEIDTRVYEALMNYEVEITD